MRRQIWEMVTARDMPTKEGHRMEKHTSGRHRSREEDGDERRDSHRHKRSRHSRDDDEEEDHPRRYTKTSDPKADLPSRLEDTPSSPKQGSKRDSWMTDPAALGIDYT